MPQVRHVQHPAYVASLAGFFCSLQPGCVLPMSSVADVTGAILLDAMVTNHDASIAAAATLAALNTSYFQLTHGFLSSSFAPQIFDGSELVSGFRHERLEPVAATELTQKYLYMRSLRRIRCSNPLARLLKKDPRGRLTCGCSQWLNLSA